jgi:hypothetical protein
MFAVRPHLSHPGAERAKFLLNDVPYRFYDFCQMDQITFVSLADWLTENTQSMTPQDVSIEESLFVFFDIVVRGSSFKAAGFAWGHEAELVKEIFLDIFNALLVLRERLGIDPECPTIKSTRSKWRVLRTWRQSRKSNGMVRVGEEYKDGVDVNQEKLLEVLLALNSFIYEHRE